MSECFPPLAKSDDILLVRWEGGFDGLTPLPLYAEFQSQVSRVSGPPVPPVDLFSVLDANCKCNSASIAKH